MITKVSGFAADENGAVSIDWVVLTAAVMVLNLVIVFSPARHAISGVLARIGETMGLVSVEMQNANALTTQDNS